MRNLICVSTVLLISCCATITSAQPRAIRAANVRGGVQQLPYRANDADGNQWVVQNGGWLQQTGNMPIYSQGGMIMINGNQPTPGAAPGNAPVRVDEKTGELVFERMNLNGILVTRRVLVNKDESYVRMIDILKNSNQQEQNVQVQIQSSLNFGINASDTIADPKNAERALGWVGQTGANRCAVEIFGGKGGKLIPTVNWPQGSNVVQGNLQVTLPPGKEIALMHLHRTSATIDAGHQYIATLKPAKILAGITPDIRKLIVNFPATQGFIGDREVLRGDLFDVVELRGGDTLNGTIKEKSYKLTTFYGPVELPSDHIVGLINVGQFRPRQLIVTGEGEIFGGTLSKETIEIELSSGQVTQVPLSQISRVGYRKRSGESDEWTFDKPMVVLRSGDRMSVALPEGTIDVLTRYGLLKLNPQSIAAVAFVTEQHGVHEVYLTDGSRFAGLVAPAKFDLKLLTTGQTISIPTSALARIQTSASPPDAADDAPALTLANDDLLVGELTGQLKLDTAFDTITVNAAELKALSRAREPDAGGFDVQAVLWDGTKFSGQLRDPIVTIALRSGTTLSIPLPLVESYSQPLPRPSASMVDRMKSMVAELSAEDWKTRDRAEAQLVAMGSAVAPILRELRPNQAPEAQQRIDSILKQLEKTTKAPDDSTGTTDPNGN